jgi:hypothetical protein
LVASLAEQPRDFDDKVGVWQVVKAVCDLLKVNLNLIEVYKTYCTKGIDKQFEWMPSKILRFLLVAKVLWNSTN